MANIKSAKKRIKVIAKKTELNKARKTKMRNSIKKLNEIILTGDKEKANEQFLITEKIIRKTASKGSIHKNNASKKVSRLKRKLNLMN